MSSNHSCANRFGKGTDSAVPSGICPDHAFSRRGTALLSLGLTVFSWGIISTLATLPMLARDAGNSPPAVEAQLPAGPMQSKAAASCLECHEARIILQQRLGKGAWTKEVDKMMKWGAVVDAADRDPLIDYLSGNFSPDKPAYEAPRTAGDAAKVSK